MAELSAAPKFSHLVTYEFDRKIGKPFRLGRFALASKGRCCFPEDAESSSMDLRPITRSSPSKSCCLEHLRDGQIADPATVCSSYSHPTSRDE